MVFGPRTAILGQVTHTGIGTTPWCRIDAEYYPNRGVFGYIAGYMARFILAK